MTVGVSEAPARSPRSARLLSVYEDAARARPDDDAVVIAEREDAKAVYSWRQVLDLGAAQAAAMADAGIPARSLVAVEGSRTVECLAAFLAVWKRGGAVVPIDPQWGQWLTERILAHSGVAGYVDACGQARATGVGAAELGSDWAIVSYTSGSTGHPKGVILGHEQLLHAYSAGACELARVTGSIPSRIACAMRVSGMGVFGIHHLWAAVMGATLVMVPELDISTAGDYWEVMARERAELTYLVPPLVALLARASSRPAHGSPLICLSGGAPLSERLQRRFQERFQTPLFNYYGLTEVGFTAFFGARAADGMASSEIGLPGTVLARLRRRDGRVALDAEATGELELAGPALALGYLEDAQEWQCAVSAGWLATGDIATRAGDGAYRITGRAKDAVMRGGFVIYLHEVEAAALELPAVVEAGALMLKGSEQLEDIGLLVYSTSLAGPSGERHVRDELVAMLGAGRAPRRVAIVDRPLPRVSQGKLDRHALGELWRHLAMPMVPA